ncbi:MAG TPA: ATP-binding protein [Planctomycetota bacterium]|nr:ATP-binding protein [Planctomycetota bacterium]HRR79706.1 ATP-binding protein [Planctomycetota bacterium]HRT97238.1 ATP-binding protein [Planctomycetota bacterium]
MAMHLRVRRGASAGAVFALRPGTNIIGRSRDCAVALSDDKVSTSHARIEVAGEAATLIDLGSTNGTLLNEAAVTAPTQLRPGDAIQVGNTTLVYGDRDHQADQHPTTQVRIIVADDKTVLQRPVAWSPEATTQVLPATGQNLEAGELRRLYGILSALYRVTSVVGRSVTLEGLFANVLDVLFDILPADHGSVLLVEPDARALKPVAGQRRNTREQTIRVSETIARDVIATGRGVLTRDAAEDERFRRVASIHLYGIRSALCVPIRSPRQTFGVIYLDTHSVDRSFTERDLELLTAVGSDLGLAVENFQLIRKNLEAERLAAIGQAVAGLSHYIKNILQSMEAARYLIPSAIANQDLAEIGEIWGALDHNIQLISELAINMLSYSRRAGPQYAPCEPNRVVREVATLVAQRAAAQNVALTLALDDAMPTALLDAGALHCALLNLLTNAIDATPGGSVTVTSRWVPAARRIEIAVADNGPGIPPALREKIFEAFYTTKGSKGSGLGLAVSRKVIGELGGRIAVESEAGRGAIFTVALPIEPPEGQADQGDAT